MGLAASQARLLMLTSRKSDIEGNLLSIANNKLSLSRQSSEISQAYSDALNAVKLTWGGDGADNGKALTYDMLMTYSAATADQGQYLLTDSSDRVILDDTYAGIIGTIDQGNSNAKSGSGEAFDSLKAVAFLEKEMGVTDDVAAKYVKTYLINEANSSTSNTEVSLSTLSTAVANVLSFTTEKNDDSTSSFGTAFKVALEQLSSDVEQNIQYEAGLSTTEMASLDYQTLSYMTDEGKTASLANTDDAELELLLRMERTVQAAEAMTSLGQMQADGGNQTAMVNAAINMLLDGGSAADWLDGTGGENGVNAVLANGDYASGWGVFDTTSTVTVDGTSAPAYTFLDYSYTGEWAGTQGGTAIDADGISYDDTAYNYTNDAAGRNQIFGENLADLSSYYSTAVTNDTGSSSDTAQADYYLNLYKAIEERGWVRSDSIDNSDSLQSMLLNGNAFLSKLDSDGNWDSLSITDSSSPIAEESDDTAINEAEATYNTEKDKVEYKENQLDLQQNNLDTERSAITTELESVQKIIDNNVKKFNMFSSNG